MEQHLQDPPVPPVDETIPDNRWLLTELRSDLRHLAQMQETTRAEISELRGYIDDKFREHRDYHKRNESRWGAVRWMEKHPWAFALIVATLIAGAREQPDRLAELTEAIIPTMQKQP